MTASSPRQETTFVSLFMTCLEDMQPLLHDAMCVNPSLEASLHSTTSLALVILIETVAKSTSETQANTLSSLCTSPPEPSFSGTKRTTQAMAHRVKTAVLQRMPATQLTALSAAAVLGEPMRGASLSARLGRALAQSLGGVAPAGGIVDCVHVLNDLVDASTVALLVFAALWMAAKFWLPALQRLSLGSLLLHMTERVDMCATEQNRSMPDSMPVEVVDLLGPPAFSDDEKDSVEAGGFVGSALRFDSSDLREGSCSEWIPTVAEAVESIEMLLLRCSEYTVPIAE